MTSSEQRLLTVQLAVIETFGSEAREEHVVKVIRMLVDQDVTFETAEEFILDARSAAQNLLLQGRGRLSLVHSRSTSDEDIVE